MSEQSEGVVGVGMLVAAFVAERGADEALKSMKEAKKSSDFYFDDAAVIRSDDKGKIHIDETGDMSSGKGAAIGGGVGAVISILGGPAGLAASAIAGAAIGALSVHKDSGFSQESLKEIGGALPPGTSAIAATTSKMFVEEVRKEAEEGVTLTLAKDLAAGIKGRLEARQDVLYTLVISEEGIAATEVVSSPSMMAVFGIASDGTTVVAGQAVVTGEGAAYEVVAADEEGTAYEVGVATDEGGAVVDVYAPADDEDDK